MADLDTLLNRGDPARAHLDDTDPFIDRMVVAARTEAQRQSNQAPRWKTPRVILPVAVGAMLLTAGAAVIIPQVVGVNGQWVVTEVTIPIHYTTDTGIGVSCQYGIYVGDPANRTSNDQALADYLNAQDWSGIGQEIYDRAMAAPFIPGPDDDLEVDNQQIRDQFSFGRAVGVIYERVPDELFVDGASSAATTTCTGQLR